MVRLCALQQANEAFQNPTTTVRCVHKRDRCRGQDFRARFLQPAENRAAILPGRFADRLQADTVNKMQTQQVPLAPSSTALRALSIERASTVLRLAALMILLGMR